MMYAFQDVTSASQSPPGGVADIDVLILEVFHD
jgi:hypothetical protein